MHIKNKQLQDDFKRIYGKDKKKLRYQNERYKNLLHQYKKHFKQEEIHLFSTPGRVELAGNHTDHNNGKVLAASINLDSIAAVSKNSENSVVFISDAFNEPFRVNLDNSKIVEEEKGTTNALIRGIAARFVELGYKIGGFNACVTSDVLQGSGLSSSASIEVLIGLIFNAFYNNNKIKPEIIAASGQYAENYYFGKPCGLMDQLACAVGGIVAIDFADPAQPIIEKVNFNFSLHNYSLIVVDTQGDHTDLTDDYAAITKEMAAIANYFDKEKLRDVDYKDFLKNVSALRTETGDRAVLRAMHFYDENERVKKQVSALQKKKFKRYLKLVQESGNSSFKWLQNLYSAKNVNEQGLSLALALTEKYIRENGKGACRVHGGGFAGTILVLLPKKSIKNYIKFISKFFSTGSVLVLDIRDKGTMQLI